VITVCRSLTEGVWAKAPAARVFQIEDPPLFDGAAPASPSDVAALRQGLGLDARPVVLYSGNFEPYQGVNLLVSAAALVPEAQLVFMGGEPGEVETRRAQAADLGVAGSCRFAGKRKPAELPAFFALADVLASPRLQGVNTPFKIYTYLASGKPLVATRLLTHTQVLDDSLAYLVEPTAEGMAKGLRAALGDPDEARRRAQRARELLAREFSPARYTEKVRAAYAAVGAVYTPAHATADPGRRG
jgi:glycosyltransferase involved in cell wall biosynthesis